MGWTKYITDPSQIKSWLIKLMYYSDISNNGHKAVVYIYIHHLIKKQNSDLTAKA